MRFGEIVRMRIRSLFRRGNVESDLDREVQFHLEEQIQEYIAAGMSAAQARRSALLEFGAVEYVKEECRDSRRVTVIDNFMQDVRFGARVLRKRAVFTTAAVLSLALGIGANSAIFSIVDALILQPLPYPAPEQLVRVHGTVQRATVERRPLSYPDFIDWQQQTQTLSGLGVYNSNTFTVTLNLEPERLPGELASASYLQLLGVKPLLGRLFTEAENETGKPAFVVVIGESLWRQRFGGDLSILGRNLNIDNQIYTIIGVLPGAFMGLTDRAQLWIPIATAQEAQLRSRGSRGLSAAGRLKPGVLLEQADAEFQSLGARLASAYPETNGSRSARVIDLKRAILGDLRSLFVALQIAVSLVLLLACVNVANLQLSRMETRRMEFAVRVSLGARNSRLTMQLFTETFLLCLLGFGVGMVLEQLLLATFARVRPVELPSYVAVVLSWRSFLFAAGLCFLSALILALVPCWRMWKEDLGSNMRAGDQRAGHSRATERLRALITVSEIACALVLLVSASLLVASFRQLARSDPGFRVEGLLSLQATLPRDGVTDEQALVLGSQMVSALQQLPGVSAAAAGSDMPLGGDSTASYFAVESASDYDPKQPPRAYMHNVSPEYFSTLSVPIKQGRAFLAEEISTVRNVVIVSEAVASRFWPGVSALGKRLTTGRPGPGSVWHEVVGVVGYVVHRNLVRAESSDPDLYFPLRGRIRTLAFAIRTHSDPNGLVQAARLAIRGVDRNTPVFNVASMAERLDRQMRSSRFASQLMGLFAALALALALIGVFGVVSYAVTQRAREIGLRIALGATPGSVFGNVVGRGILLALGGVAVGLLISFFAVRYVQDLLFQVKVSDTAIWFIAAAVIVLTTISASAIPALRAMRTDPISVLREQ